MKLEDKLKSAVRNIPGFPRKGVIFRDITPLLLNPSLSGEIVLSLAGFYHDQKVDVVAGIESRGFLFGFPLAIKLGTPFALIRKKGKLPYKKIAEEYQLEYGTATIEIHIDAIKPRQKVLIHDDLLATGGSAVAAARLVEKCGGVVAGFSFLIELEELGGRTKLAAFSKNINSLAKY